MERPVDAVADPDLLLVRLDVDVGDALEDRVGEQSVDELHDRSGVDLGLEGSYRDVVLRILDDLHVLGPELLEEIRHSEAVAATVVIVQVFSERVLADDDRFDLKAGNELQVVDRAQVRGIDHRHRERAPYLTEG